MLYIIIHILHYIYLTPTKNKMKTFILKKITSSIKEVTLFYYFFCLLVYTVVLASRRNDSKLKTYFNFGTKTRPDDGQKMERESTNVPKQAINNSPATLRLVFLTNQEFEGGQHPVMEISSQDLSKKKISRK